MTDATTLHPITPAQLSDLLTPDVTAIRVSINGVLHEVHSIKDQNGTVVLDAVPTGTLRDLLAAGWFIGSYQMSGEFPGLLWTHPQAPTAAAPTWWALLNIATPEACDPSAAPQPGWYPGQWQLLSRAYQIPGLETFEDSEDLRGYLTQYAGYMRGVGIPAESVSAVHVLRDEDGGESLVMVSNDAEDDLLTSTVTVIFNRGHAWGPPLS